MNCAEVEQQLDDYLDLPENSPAGLDERAAAAIALHVQGCPVCAAELEQRQLLRDDLRTLEAPAPAADFLQRAVATAVAAEEVGSGAETTNRRRDDALDSQPGRRPMTLITGLAAALVGALLIGTLLVSRPDQAPEPGIPGIHLATDTVTPVKLAFSSETALADARLSLSLPVGVELVGYDGQSDLSWNTDLEEGTNVLRLPLVGRVAASDVLVATLEHPSGSKTFRLQVTVN